jgi:hypothetical protein
VQQVLVCRFSFPDGFRERKNLIQNTEKRFGIKYFLPYIRQHMHGATHTKQTKKQVLNREGV